jgi:hypothetical protein
VETAEDADILRFLGIDYGQGYFFSEPLPGRELAMSPRVGIVNPEHPGKLSPLGASAPLP